MQIWTRLNLLTSSHHANISLFLNYTTQNCPQHNQTAIWGSIVSLYPSVVKTIKGWYNDNFIVDLKKVERIGIGLKAQDLITSMKTTSLILYIVRNSFIIPQSLGMPLDYHLQMCRKLTSSDVKVMEFLVL